MKNRILLLVIAIFMLSISKAQNKIGYVNDSKVFAAMPEVDKALKDAESFGENLSKELSEAEDAIIKQKSSWDKDSINHTRAENKKYYDTFIQKYKEVYEKKMNIENSITTMRENLFKPIREKVVSVIKDHAKQNGYAHILYENNVLVLNTEDDITTKIIEKLKSK
jgi:outer membrane protein